MPRAPDSSPVFSPLYGGGLLRGSSPEAVSTQSSHREGYRWGGLWDGQPQVPSIALFLVSPRYTRTITTVFLIPSPKLTLAIK